MKTPLMPKSTAVWLLDNTALTFQQIADFCGLHLLEVEALADGEGGIMGLNPVANNQLTSEEISACEQDADRRLLLTVSSVEIKKKKSSGKYTPLTLRQNIPDAVAWLVRHHSELSDAHIMRLVGTTKATLEKIKNKTHWNMQNIRPRSPVDFGILTQQQLDEALSSPLSVVAEKKKSAAKKKTVAQKTTKKTTVKKPVESSKKKVETSAAKKKASKTSDKKVSDKKKS